MGIATDETNTYRYVANDPVTWVDPLGLQSGQADSSEFPWSEGRLAGSIVTSAFDNPVSRGFGGVLLLFDFADALETGAGAIVSNNPQGVKIAAVKYIGVVCGVAALAGAGLPFTLLAIGLGFAGMLMDSGSTSIDASVTPEDKFGTTGYDDTTTAPGGEMRFIAGDASEPLPYRIDFWNDPDATVPTQDAIIVDELDPNVFDVATFQFTRFGFLKWDESLEGVQEIDTRIDLRPDMNLAVEVRAGLGMQVPRFAANDDINENTLVWWFHAVDPLTGQYPEDPMAGFLPPFNEATEYELGWVEFTVQLKDGLTTGTQVANLAYVEFDFLQDLYAHPAPKKDPDAEVPEPWPWANTIDAGIPADASHVNPLPATTDTLQFEVTWTGADDVGGSGIATYDVFVSIDGGTATPWLQNTGDTSRTYTGEIDHTYAFYSIATDNVGHREPAPLVPDAVTVVRTTPWHNVANAYDVDNSGGQRPVTAQDALFVIDYINAHPDSTALPSPPTAPPPYYDVNGDGLCTATDVLLVIDYINSQPASQGEGEAGTRPTTAEISETSWNLLVPDSVAITAAAITQTHFAPIRAFASDLEFEISLGRFPERAFDFDRDRSWQPRGAATRSGSAVGEASRFAPGRTTRAADLARRVWQAHDGDEEEADWFELDGVLPDLAQDVAAVWGPLPLRAPMNW
jgi:hypothetical protein